MAANVEDAPDTTSARPDLRFEVQCLEVQCLSAGVHELGSYIEDLGHLESGRLNLKRRLKSLHQMIMTLRTNGM